MIKLLTIAGSIFCLLTVFCSDVFYGNEKSSLESKSVKVESVQKVASSSSETYYSMNPLQPRKDNGKFMCTKNRYIKGEQQVGVASWYGKKFHGKLMSNGKRFNQNADTLASLTLPMGTKVIVKNPKNGKAVLAKVTDCGPYVEGRIVDLSKGLANKLDLAREGIGEVVVQVL